MIIFAAILSAWSVLAVLMLVFAHVRIARLERRLTIHLTDDFTYRRDRPALPEAGRLRWTRQTRLGLVDVDIPVGGRQL